MEGAKIAGRQAERAKNKDEAAIKETRKYETMVVLLFNKTKMKGT